MSIAVFDLDGTISDSRQRVHLLKDLNDPLRWRKFYAASKQDAPIQGTISVFCALIKAGVDVRIWTARSDEVRAITNDWLAEHTGILPHRFQLRMRPVGVRTPDYILKKEWYDELSEREKKQVLLVFEDRTRVVNMWRGLGIQCMQVAPGDF